MQRRHFLLTSAAAVGLGATAGAAHQANPDEKPQIDSKLVSQFVGKSHFDLQAIREMLDQEPAVVNAAWDWGNGDWETGLGAASHVGRPDIAELILEKGGRLDQFAATMLGWESVVKAMLDVRKDLHQVPGPHGIPLLSHGVVSRKAQTLCELLLDRGADVQASSNGGMTPLMMAASTGNLQIIELLVQRGAKLDATDAEARTAVDWAERRKQKEAAELLRRLAS